jgi:cytochrome P450
MSSSHKFITNINFINILRLSKIISNRCREPIMYLEPVYRLTRSYYREKKYRKRCYEYLDHILKERRDFITPYNNNNMCKASSSSKRVGDEEMGVINIDNKNFIDQLILSDNHKLTDEEIHDHIYTFIAAGYETIALQTAYTLLLLAMHTNEQEKLYREICEVNLTVESKVDKSHLDRMKYLDAVMRESMRLMPAVPIVGREVMEELQLNDLKVPKSVTMIINFFKLHRRQDLWGADAGKFDPERFIGNNESNYNHHSFSFLPFSAGARDCIGKYYAKFAMKIIIVDFIRHYKISTDLKYEELKFKSDVTLKLCQKMLVKIEKR